MSLASLFEFHDSFDTMSCLVTVWRLQGRVVIALCLSPNLVDQAAEFPCIIPYGDPMWGSIVLLRSSKSQTVASVSSCAIPLIHRKEILYYDK